MNFFPLKPLNLYSFSLFALFFLLIPNISFSQQIVGWIEKAKLSSEGIELLAKIDSGADNSSLHYVNKEYFEKDGERWVHLKITDDKNKSYILDRKIIRIAKIKRHDGKFQIRDVIELEICLGKIYKNAEVNLENRAGLQYQLLIGRSFLKNDFLIDPSQKNIVESNCKLSQMQND